jgi:nitroreductase
MIDKSAVKITIQKSQHCQRNWDLTRSIPQEDIDLLVEAVTQCPSKQNAAFYRCHFITNRTVIEQVYNNTSGFDFPPSMSIENNSQTLANMLVVFEQLTLADILTANSDRPYLNTYFEEFRHPAGLVSDTAKKRMLIDIHMSIGIASGYLNLLAHQLGYSTGYCGCFDIAGLQTVLNIQGQPMIILGVGYKDINRNRRIHHTKPDLKYPAKPKVTIPVLHIS